MKEGKNVRRREIIGASSLWEKSLACDSAKCELPPPKTLAHMIRLFYIALLARGATGEMSETHVQLSIFFWPFLRDGNCFYPKTERNRSFCGGPTRRQKKNALKACWSWVVTPLPHD